MRTKLKLDLEHLLVDSFDTAEPEPAKGTVFGEQCTCYTNCTCPGCPTCDNTACGQNTCAASCACASGWDCNPSFFYTDCDCPDTLPTGCNYNLCN